PRAIGAEVIVSRILALVLQQRVRQRAEHRLGVLPADRFERAEGVGDVDRLVADVAEVAGATAGEQLEAGFPPGRAGARARGRPGRPREASYTFGGKISCFAPSTLPSRPRAKPGGGPCNSRFNVATVARPARQRGKGTLRLHGASADPALDVTA